MLVEFAIIILLTRRKPATDDDVARKRELKSQNEKTLSLQLSKAKISPITNVSRLDIHTIDENDDDGESTEEVHWMDGIKKCTLGISAAQAIDLMALGLFIFIFVWFNVDQLLPLIDW